MGRLTALLVALAATAGLAACGGDESGSLASGAEGSPAPGASTALPESETRAKVVGRRSK